ncbi:MAG: AAA family ATPase [Selenomonadaceae bacterium]|nr:AAA family ATPase [Selenomonadaceae bacterium]
MGTYLNPGNTAFKEALNSEIYVDKSILIDVVSSKIGTMQKYICVSRPRRFGKSVAMNMLAAYYSRGCNSEAIFKKLEIAKAASFKKYLNRYNVIRLNMQEFLSDYRNIDGMLAAISKYLLKELLKVYPGIDYMDKNRLRNVMSDIHEESGIQFIILIDEWDCIFREYKKDKKSQDKYLDFLRAWLKDQEYVGLVYMTGILPIKKYGTHSALNMFTEYSMTSPGELAEFFGFTDAEVKGLCTEYNWDYDELKDWYDGYELSVYKQKIEYKCSIYNPKSVTAAIEFGKCDTYWNRTETYEALKQYIQMNMDGLKDAIVTMMAGGSVEINPDTFVNDMSTFEGRDDVMTLLIHLGYLSYNAREKTVSIPNREVAKEYYNAVSTMDWKNVMTAITDSKQLLQDLLDGKAELVAAGIDKAHEEIAILQYNDENSLSCVIGLAFYSAREFYQTIREMPAGRGFADIVFLPLPNHADKPAILIELKWDQEADTAIRQIHEKRYDGVLKGYEGNIILAGISYDKATKKHSCIIEKI